MTSRQLPTVSRRNSLTHISTSTLNVPALGPRRSNVSIASSSSSTYVAGSLRSSSSRDDLKRLSVSGLFNGPQEDLSHGLPQQLKKQVRFDDATAGSGKDGKSRSHWLDELQERKGDVLKWLEDVGTKRKDALNNTAQAGKVGAIVLHLSEKEVVIPRRLAGAAWTLANHFKLF